MNSRGRRFGWGALLLVAAAIPMAVQVACAQWVPNGVSLGRSLYWPRAAADGQGGAFVLTSDWSTENATGRGVRLSHVTADGVFGQGWSASGIPIAQTPSSRDWEYPGAACAQADGSYSVAVESQQSRLLVTRIRPDGTSVPGWDPPFLAAPSPNPQHTASMCATPDDGCILLFFSAGYVVVARLTATGQTAPGWPAAGRNVGLPSGSISPVAPDGEGGAWFSYSQPNGPTGMDVFLQHVDSLGIPAPGFSSLGRVAVSAPGVQEMSYVCSDGAGGVFVAWSDSRACPYAPEYEVINCYDVYLQHFNGSGDVVAGWPANGLPVCLAPVGQMYPKLLPDGGGGVYVCWEGPGPQGVGGCAQRILANGEVAPGWPSGGRSMFSLNTYSNHHEMVLDAAGGLFFASYAIDPQYGVRPRLQHVTSDGQFDAVWGATGIPLASTFTNDNHNLLGIAPSLPGSVIVAWEDYRSQEDRVYVARVSLDGVVATTVSLVSQDATAERVALAWQAGGDALAQATVERHAPGEAFRTLATVYSDGTGTLRYEDRDITPGARYAYRLVWSEAGGTQTSPEVRIEVPTAARFALAGASPNPSPRASLSIAYSLAESAPARLELYDAQGRVVARRDLAAREPGAHRERFAEAAGLRAGLYWLRLTQGANSATARVVLVD